MAKVKSEPESVQDLPVVESITIQNVGASKFACILIRTQGEQIVGTEVLGDPGAKGYAVMEFKKWAARFFQRA